MLPLSNKLYIQMLSTNVTYLPNIHHVVPCQKLILLCIVVRYGTIGVSAIIFIFPNNHIKTSRFQNFGRDSKALAAFCNA